MKILFIQSLILFSVTVSAKVDHEHLYTHSFYDELSQISTVEIAGISSRPLKELIAIYDPQNWSKCSNYFQESKLVDLKTLATRPKRVGSAWRGLLLEKLIVSNIIANNLLNYSSYPINHQATVGLAHIYFFSAHMPMNKYIKGTFFNLGLDLDQGMTRIEALPDGRWKLVGTKLLRFKLKTPEETQVANKSALAFLVNFMENFSRDLSNCQLN